MFVTKKTYFESARMIESFATESNISNLIDNLLVDQPEYVPYDELMIRRLHQQAFDSPRAMRYFEGRRISENSVKTFLL